MLIDNMSTQTRIRWIVLNKRESERERKNEFVGRMVIMDFCIQTHARDCAHYKMSCAKPQSVYNELWLTIIRKVWYRSLDRKSLWVGGGEGKDKPKTTWSYKSAVKARKIPQPHEWKRGKKPSKTSASAVTGWPANGGCWEGYGGRGSRRWRRETQ